MKDENQTLFSRDNFQDRRIAVVGVSQNPDKNGHRIFVDLLEADYDVVGVHPEAGIVEGQKLWPSLYPITPRPDLVITVVPPSVTERVVQNCIQLGIKQIWMQPGSESTVAIETAQKAGLEVISQACFMKYQALW